MDKQVGLLDFWLCLSSFEPECQERKKYLAHKIKGFWFSFKWTTCDVKLKQNKLWAKVTSDKSGRGHYEYIWRKTIMHQHSCWGETSFDCGRNKRVSLFFPTNSLWCISICLNVTRSVARLTKFAWLKHCTTTDIVPMSQFPSSSSATKFCCNTSARTQFKISLSYDIQIL